MPRKQTGKAKTDQARLTDINTESKFRDFLNKFFKLRIYGDFFKSKECQQKIKKIKFQDIERYKNFFNVLSVANQPEISIENINWEKNSQW